MTISRLFCLVLFALCLNTATGQENSRVDSQVTQKQEHLTPGDQTRTLLVDGLERTALIHVPRSYNPDNPTAVVLALHGAAMTGRMMAAFSGMTQTADEKGFVVVYPNGVGREPLLSWNAGGFGIGLGSQADDVRFLSQLLDEICRIVNVDKKRIYACGMSNGGMMCYRLAAELSERFAAIAPVGGTMADNAVQPTCPVSVIHFHGTSDKFVPFEIEEGKWPLMLRVKSVNETIQTWAKFDGCDNKPASTEVLSKDSDELKVSRETFGPGTDGAEVVLVTIEGGGHCWPGMEPPFRFLGKSTLTVSANELIWTFFEKHAKK